MESFKEEVTTKLALVEKGLKASSSKYVPLGRATGFGKAIEGQAVNRVIDAKERKKSYTKK
jgi:hypothetical protein